MSLPIDHFDAAHFSDIANTEEGHKLWSMLQQPETLVRMETATYLGRPALEAIQPKLLEEFDSVIHQDRWKQLAGRMVRQIMEDQGYRLDRSGVRLKRNELFLSASRYVKH